MKFQKNSIRLFMISIMICVVLVTIHYRTPFYTAQGGAWSVGTGSDKYFLPNLPLKNDGLISFQKLKKGVPGTEFIADPFFVKVKDTFYLFVEHQFSKPNAVVSLFKSIDGINYEYDRIVLKEKFHLSYPQVFQYRNEYYMLPETTQSGNVLLYKAHNFPYDWKVTDTLLQNVKLKDPTLFLSDTLNFLYGSDSELNLKMFVSDSLHGKWFTHKKAIIASGTEARPGGRIIVKDGKFIIPVQNSQNGYGSGLSLYNLEFEKDSSYQFIPFKKLYLNKQDSILEFSYGMHHLDFQLIDGKYYYVYDGNIKLDKSNLNLWGPLKWNFIDLKNYFYQM